MLNKFTVYMSKAPIQKWDQEYCFLLDTFLLDITGNQQWRGSKGFLQQPVEGIINMKGPLYYLLKQTEFSRTSKCEYRKYFAHN